MSWVSGEGDVMGEWGGALTSEWGGALMSEWGGGCHG